MNEDRSHSARPLQEPGLEVVGAVRATPDRVAQKKSLLPMLSLSLSLSLPILLPSRPPCLA